MITLPSSSSTYKMRPPTATYVRGMEADPDLSFIVQQSSPRTLPALFHDSGTTRPARSEGLVISDEPTPRLIEVLTRAFRREPHNDWLFRNDGQRDQGFARYLNIYLSEIARRGATFIMSTEMDAAAIVGSSVEADHYLSIRALIRIIPAVIHACTPWRLHRMIAMEYALLRAHPGMKHLPHLVFMGGIEPRSQSTRRIGRYLKERHPLLAAETADHRVAALACRRGAIETGRARPLFGGPEMIFLLYRSRLRHQADVSTGHAFERPA